MSINSILSYSVLTNLYCFVRFLSPMIFLIFIENCSTSSASSGKTRQFFLACILISYVYFVSFDLFSSAFRTVNLLNGQPVCVNCLEKFSICLTSVSCSQKCYVSPQVSSWLKISGGSSTNLEFNVISNYCQLGVWWE